MLNPPVDNVLLITLEVVPKLSSLLGDIREEAETLHANHMNMCRFNGPNDPNYLKVGGELESICRLVQTKERVKYSLGKI